MHKCGFTHASRAEIRIFTPRDIKFRTILVRKTFSWQVWLYHSPSARAANSHSSENVSSHSYRNVLFRIRSKNMGVCLVRIPPTCVGARVNLQWLLPLFHFKQHKQPWPTGVSKQTINRHVYVSIFCVSPTQVIVSALFLDLLLEVSAGTAESASSQAVPAVMNQLRPPQRC